MGVQGGRQEFDVPECFGSRVFDPIRSQSRSGCVCCILDVNMENDYGVHPVETALTMPPTPYGIRDFVGTDKR
jgi:hypothetical protein